MATVDLEPTKSSEIVALGNGHAVQINYISQPEGRIIITGAAVGNEVYIRGKSGGAMNGLAGLGQYASKEEARAAAIKAARKKIEELNS